MATVKYKRVLITSVVNILLILPCLAQKEANVWIMGDDYGIDFNFDRFITFDRPDFKDSTLSTTASICDKNTGTLLFYSNGLNVWNSSFEVMPNGRGLRGGGFMDQTVLIVPHPGDDMLYYLFTSRSYGDSIDLTPEVKQTGLHYSLVDMNLDGGLGDIKASDKNTLILRRSTEKLTAVPHSNGIDFWLITHEWGTNRFIVYPITSTGVGQPTYFPFGLIHNMTETEGRLHASPNGQMLVNAVYSYDSKAPLELYDFDADTGIISNRRVLGDYKKLICGLFSPDNSKLYFSYSGEDSSLGEPLYQFDLNAGTLDNIIASRFPLKWELQPFSNQQDIIVPVPACDLQLAPDGRLYNSCIGIMDNSEGVVKRIIFFLDNPNNPGNLAIPSYRFLDSPNNNTKQSIIGQEFPNFMQSYFNNLEPVDNSVSQGECADINLILYPNPTTDFLAIESSIQNCLFPASIKIYNNLGQLLSSFEVTSEPFPSINVSSYSPGTYYIRIGTFNRFSVKKIIKRSI